jgi:hypothetical protein
MVESKNHSLFKRLEGYLLIPHELLHVLGYRLVGQPCEYRWGDSFVTPTHSMTRRQDLIGMLFPSVIFFILVTVFGLLAGFAAEAAVREGKLFWFIFWLALTYITGIYLGSTLVDLRRAYLLIVGKPWYSWTPFDILFQPLVDWDDIRRKVAKGEIDDQQD